MDDFRTVVQVEIVTKGLPSRLIEELYAWAERHPSISGLQVLVSESRPTIDTSASLDVLDRHLITLGLSTSVYNSLTYVVKKDPDSGWSLKRSEKDDIETIGDLVMCTAKKLDSFRGIADRSIDQIRAKLADIGLSLAGESTDPLSNS